MADIKAIERAINTFEYNYRQACKCENSECLEDCEMCDDTKEIILQAIQEKLEREKLHENCACKNIHGACCTCVSMQCQWCRAKSKYASGSYCSACGRKLGESK